MFYSFIKTPILPVELQQNQELDVCHLFWNFSITIWILIKYIKILSTDQEIVYKCSLNIIENCPALWSDKKNQLKIQ